MVVEVMGRYAGWIALYAAMAGGADAVLIPEIPFDLERVAACVMERERFGARSSIVVAAEGARPIGGDADVDRREQAGPARAAWWNCRAGLGWDLRSEPARRADSSCSATSSGGGVPWPTTAYSRPASAVTRSIWCGRASLASWSRCAHPSIVAVPLEHVVGRIRTVPLGSDVVRVARNLGMCLGD